MANTSSNRTTDATAVKKHVHKVRRAYSVDIARDKRVLHSEKKFIEQMVLVLHLARYSKVQTARIVGISVQQVTQILNQPDVNEAVLTLRTQLPQAALDLLQNYMIEAVQTIVDVMRTTGDDKVALTAAADILDRAGIPKSSKTSSHKITEEKLTITDDGIVEKLREAPVEVQEEAAQIIEKLEQLLADSSKE